MTAYRVYLGLGSNKGDRGEALAQAIAAISELGEVEARSQVWETEPVGQGLSGLFLNAALALCTEMAPPDLLIHLLGIESRMGRNRAEGPDRIVDIDVLLVYNLASRQWETWEHPQVPHPRMWDRDFVMLPLGEVCADLDDVRSLFA